MHAACLCCGIVSEVEAHHVAGRHNNATLTVPVCISCHRILTTWQHAAGIELHEDAVRDDLDESRALVVGVLHLVQLVGQRHAESSWVSAELAAITARAMSRILDGIQDLDRPGRWLPDPTYRVDEATPVAWNAETEATLTADFAQLTVQVAEILGDAPPVTVARLREIATRPQDFDVAFAAIAEDQSATGMLIILVEDFLDRAEHLVNALLQLPPGQEPDGALTADGVAFFQSAHRLIDSMFNLADQAMARTRHVGELGGS